MKIKTEHYEYRLVSRQDGGNYSGPCPFYGRGDDRFSFWPNTQTQTPNWYCRKECPDCPGHKSKSGGRWGLLENVPELADLQVKEHEGDPPPDMQDVEHYVSQRSSKTLLYLAERGITDVQTIDRFHIGEQDGRRLTIPLVTHSRETKCHGIKKRWIGEPPNTFIAKYLMDPGSKARALYNIDVLLQGQRPYCMVVESQLDVILLAQFGIPAVAPFAGGAGWSQDWRRYFRNVEQVIVVADIDQPDQDGNRGGNTYAQRRAQTFSEVVLVYPPSGSDLTDAYLLGYDLNRWAQYVREEICKT